MRTKVPDRVPNIPQVPNPIIKSKLPVFEAAMETDILKVIMKSASKYCNLDPIPTGFLKKILDIIIMPITEVEITNSINLEFVLVFSKKRMSHYCWKNHPFSKNDLKKCKPISNLSFSKILEKVVSSCLPQKQIGKSIIDSLSSQFCWNAKMQFL